MSSFFTIASISKGEYKEKGSKFLAFAHPVQNENEVREIVKSYKKEYYDARHHCYAFIIGKDKGHFRAADDGEPSNSAGMPILGQLRSKEVTNTLVVVVRYFGGTKLGVPGLVHAYKTAAEDALKNAFIVKEYVTFSLKLYFEYASMNDIMRIIKEHQFTIVSQELETRCIMVVKVKEEEYQLATSKFKNWLEKE